MNVSDKLQLIRALEEREVSARRWSGAVAWTSVLVAAVVLSVMIGLGQRRLASLNGRLSSVQQELVQSEKTLAQTTSGVKEAEARLATVKKEIDEALKNARGKDVTKVVDNLEAAEVAAGAPSVTGGAAGPNSSVSRKEAITQLFDQSPAVRVRAYGSLLPRYADDSSLVPEILEVARKNPDNANGTYNALVVLSHMRATSLTPHRAAIIAFAEQSQGIGPRVAERARTLIGRVPSGPPGREGPASSRPRR